MNVLDLFSGIGGFSLGLERAGMRTVAFCEIDPYCRKVLAQHWPDVPIYDDVRTLTAAEIMANARNNGRMESDFGAMASLTCSPCGERRKQAADPRYCGIDVICGGFPCQDISTAGKGAGLAGSRSGLWSEYARIIGELRPRYVIVENVAALLGRGLGTVLGDLAALGYDAEWHCIPASAVGAPHRRDRVWIVAHARCFDRLGRGSECGGSQEAGARDRAARSGQYAEHVADANGPRLEGWLGESLRQCAYQRIAWASDTSADANGEPSFGPSEPWGECGHWLVEPDVGRVAHGIPSRVDRLKGLGNAVVPQIPEIIGRAIMRAAE